MQDALIRLTEYWSSNGCVITQPMNTEVGAGTLNPATALRVLGPEPWRVAYVEPSVRPDDSRYGDNPNRLQTHTQFQVILKPEPGDAQELYLGSLAALGIDLGRNDVRFVEDDWASPALGAWGLGWEVWLNGLEITQFTYFQQSGGFNLDPVSVEITYGMERIIMALQGVTHFKDITYAPGISYGEVFGQTEYEMSRYYLDDADIDTIRTLFEAYEGEARRLTEARLPVPAHGYVLKCSHTFNVLDARGAIGATERARAFGRMRTLAHEVAKLWIQRREELGYPLGWRPLPCQSRCDPTPGHGSAGLLRSRSRSVWKSCLPRRCHAPPMRSCKPCSGGSPRLAFAMAVSGLSLHHAAWSRSWTRWSLRRKASPRPCAAPASRWPTMPPAIPPGRRSDLLGRRASTWSTCSASRSTVASISGRFAVCRAAQRRKCSPRCSVRSSPTCAPRRTCAGTRPACPSPARSAGSSHCSASTSCPSLFLPW